MLQVTMREEIFTLHQQDAQGAVNLNPIRHPPVARMLQRSIGTGEFGRMTSCKARNTPLREGTLGTVADVPTHYVSAGWSGPTVPWWPASLRAGPAGQQLRGRGVRGMQLPSFNFSNAPAMSGSAHLPADCRPRLAAGCTAASPVATPRAVAAAIGGAGTVCSNGSRV